LLFSIGIFLSFLFFTPVKNLSARETIDFSGYKWRTKNSVHEVAGPGPNYWSSSGRNLRLDESGNLHLRIDEHKGRWYATEVWLDKALGYGTYRFKVSFPEPLVDENVVFGLFNYLNDKKEFDIEISQWGQETSLNAGFAVQPAGTDHNTHRFALNLERGATNIFTFTWTRSELTFQCMNCKTNDCSQSTLSEQWQYEGSSVPSGNLKTHMNLWLVDGKPPTNGKEVEIIIEDFSFVPL